MSLVIKTKIWSLISNIIKQIKYFVSGAPKHFVPFLRHSLEFLLYPTPVWIRTSSYFLTQTIGRPPTSQQTAVSTDQMERKGKELKNSSRIRNADFFEIWSIFVKTILKFWLLPRRYYLHPSMHSTQHTIYVSRILAKIST